MTDKPSPEEKSQDNEHDSSSNDAAKSPHARHNTAETKAAAEIDKTAAIIASSDVHTLATKEMSSEHTDALPATKLEPKELLDPAPKKRTKATASKMIGRILGKYQLIEVLGEGGMGQVFCAEHRRLGRRVALKLLRPEFAVNRDAVHRFFQEAKAVNTIGHDNIVDITDFVELETGETFFIMELLEGKDLGQIQRKSAQTLPPNEALSISVQICDALVAAHHNGIIHRDLKPDNIFIIRKKNKALQVKLLDFGVAKLMGDNSEQSEFATMVGSVIGTPAYMSPEQASGLPVDARSDIYSLGTILYEIFTGCPVFRAKSFGEYVIKHMNERPVSPRNLPDAPKIPAQLEKLILRCLEKTPKDRYQTVDALREDLLRLQSIDPSLILTEPPSSNLQYVHQAKKSARKPFLLAGVLLALLSVGLLYFFLEQKVEPKKDSISPKAKRQALLTEQPVAKKPLSRITIVSHPAGAEIFRLGSEISLGKTPLQLTLEEKGKTITFVFKHPGYITAKETVHLVGYNHLEHVLIREQNIQLPKIRRVLKTKAKQAKKEKKAGSIQVKVIPQEEKKQRPTKPKATKRILPSDVVDPFASE